MSKLLESDMYKLPQSVWRAWQGPLLSLNDSPQTYIPDLYSLIEKEPIILDSPAA